MIWNLSRDAAYRDRRFCVLLIPFRQEREVGIEMPITAFFIICTYFYDDPPNFLHTVSTMGERASLNNISKLFLLTAADTYFISNSRNHDPGTEFANSCARCSLLPPQREAYRVQRTLQWSFKINSPSIHPPAVLVISPLPYIITQQFSQYLITYFDNPYRNNDCSENYGV